MNAIVEPRYDLAIKEAKCIDKMIASNERSPEDLAKEYPLLGIPMTVKESIAVEGNKIIITINNISQYWFLIRQRT